jgi:hypothetical protein
MKYAFYYLLAGLFFIAASCKKTSFITSPDAAVAFSADTLHFDTVFTTTGSVTQLVKIFNQNDQRLKLSNVALKGGTGSAFKINVDGIFGTTFSNVELEANDSIYIFVTVSINPNADNLPFVVQDSILVQYNGNERFIQLDAFGQNANFFRGIHITQDTTWKNELPFVILDSINIDNNATLSIDSGCRVYFHANAPFLVNGSLHVNGDSLSRVQFLGDRLDPGYRDLPGSWPGIFFTSSSKNNVLNYAVVKNAYQGIITGGDPGPGTKIALNQCIIDNIFDAGILRFASSIKATNCQISNCGSNIYLSAGGDYSFNHCTIVTYGSFYIQHKNPVVFVTDVDDDGTPRSLTATFNNSIIYGEGGTVDDEVVVRQRGTSPTSGVNFTNVLYKNKSNTIDALFVNALKNQVPGFAEIDTNKDIFNFRLNAASFAIDAGNTTNVTGDLDGKPRPVGSGPDLGCFEYQQ